MTRMNMFVRVAPVVVAVAISAACSDRTERKVESGADATANSAERAGGAVAGAARDAGNAVGDAARATGDAVMNGGRAADAAVETLDVKAALSADSRVDASNINVDSNHVSKTVTLNGRVPTDAQKTLAEDIAKAKATGYTVRNMLTVGR